MADQQLEESRVFDVLVVDAPGGRARVVDTVATQELAEQLADQLRSAGEDRPYLAWWHSRAVQVED